MRPLLKSVADNRNVTALVDVYVDVYRADAGVRPCNRRFTPYTCSLASQCLISLQRSDIFDRYGMLCHVLLMPNRYSLKVFVLYLIVNRN